MAGRFPRLLRLPKLALPPNPTLVEDREAYIASLRRCPPSQAVSWMLLIQTSGDVDFHDCLLESMISKGTHLSLANMNWKLPNQKPHRTLGM